MARTFQLTDGSTTVDLIDTDATGIIAQRHGFGDATIPVGIREGTQVVERWTFNMKGSSHDNLASQLQTLTKLIRQAKEFSMEQWRDRSVYLQQQMTNETNARYAHIFEVVEYSIPDPFDLPAEANNELEGLVMTVVREHPWGSNAPGSLPSASTLGESDGPSTPTIVHVANFRDDGDLTHVFHYDDGGSSFSSNLLSAANETDLFAGSPEANDALYLGSTDIAWKHGVVGIATAANVNWDIKLQYYNGSSFTDMAFGTDYTLFAENGGEVTSEDNLFNQTGQWTINVFPPSDWAKTTINSQNAYWVKVLLNGVTSTTTIPEKNGDTIYAQRSPYVEVPAAVIAGDSPMLSCVRMWAPSGGDESPGPSSLSRVLMFSKSRGLDTFTPFLNAGGNDNPAAWTVTDKTDGSSTADVDAPGGAHCAVDFSSDTTMTNRVELAGDDILDDYKGLYRLFLRVQQVGGDPGDIRCRVRTYLGATGASDPQHDSLEQATTGADQGLEVMDLGVLALPFTRLYSADGDDIDVVFHIYAERITGSATLEIHDLIVMPVDEGNVGVDDFAIDVTSGSGALRGGTFLDLDNGLIANRTVKYWYDGTNAVPSSSWDRMNRPPAFANVGTKTRLYFLMLHYASGASVWGKEPMIASTGCHLAVEFFANPRFSVLRGSS